MSTVNEKSSVQEANENVVYRNALQSTHETRAKIPTIRFWPPVFLFLLIIGVVELFLRWRNVPEAVFPFPSSVIYTLYTRVVDIWPHLMVTIQESLSGFVIGSLFAVLTALIFTLSQTAKTSLLPILIAVQTIPVIVFAPLLTMLMGNGLAPKIAVSALICYFPIVVNMVRGLNSPSRLLVDLFTAYNATRLQMLFKLRLPASMEYLFPALKIAAANCFIGSLVAEWISADQGAGYLMVISLSRLETATLYATVVLTSVSAIALYRIVHFTERLLLPWAQHSKSKLETY